MRTGFRKKTDKSELFGIFCGELDTAPLIKECPVCMSCSLYEAVKLPSDVLYIGEPKEVFTGSKVHDRQSTGHKKGERGSLAPCPDFPNCVSTQSRDSRHAMAPLPFLGNKF